MAVTDIVTIKGRPGRFAFLALVFCSAALGKATSGTRPLRQLPPRYSYAAKFVCGWAGSNAIFWPQFPPLRHTEPGHYSTIVNVHNPWPADVTILKKVVVASRERQAQIYADVKDPALLFRNFANQSPPIYPTIRFQATLPSDQTLSIDC